jgi:hypothetical protein
MITPIGIHRFRLANTEFVPAMNGEGSTPEVFRIQKSAEAVGVFSRLRELLLFRAVLQLTRDDIGVAALATLVGAPRRIVVASTEQADVEPLLEFADRRGMSDRMVVQQCVDLEDEARLRELVTEQFGRDELEVVIDDASDRLGPGLCAFEALFPSLVPGGAYVLERWSWDHFFLEGFLRAIEDDDRERIESIRAQNIERVSAEKGNILEAILPKLVAGLRCRPDIVARLVVSKHALVVTRGPAPIEDGFRLDDIGRD